ncbi:MAG: hypothetical protein ACYS1A_17920, partial [Planctomycetota bacterium]
SINLIRGVTNRLNAKEYDLFNRKLLLEDFAETAAESKSLPFGYKNAKEVKADLASIDKAIAGNPRIKAALDNRAKVMDAVRLDYIEAMKTVGYDVSKKLTRKAYFRHQVLEYANAKNVFGTGAKLKTPTGRGFTKQRKGSELDIHPDYIQAEHEVFAQMLYDIEIAKAIKAVDKNYNIIDELREIASAKRKDLKAAAARLVTFQKRGLSKKVRAARIKREYETMAKREGGTTWEELVPEGYTTWQPKEGNVFYVADSIPAKISDALLEGKLKEIGITAEDIRPVLAMAGKRKQFVVKEEIAATLDKLVSTKSENVIATGHRKLLRGWKIWQLISPRRYMKYNFRNVTGDADAAFAGRPSVFKRVPEAYRELADVYINKKTMKGDILDWFERGGMEGVLQAQEMGQLNKLKVFKRLSEKHGGYKNIPVKAWTGYWKTARLSTDMREALLRLAAYKQFLSEIKKNGRPKDYAASIPEEIKGLANPKDKAYWMSNDLLGAYDRVGVFGQALREHMYPFWSWKEVNFRRYIRMMRNAANDGRLIKQIGRKTLGSAVIKTPYRAWKMSRWLLRATAFWVMIQTWNHLRFPQEEKELPESVRNKPHLILGRNEDGTIDYFSRLGALGDLLENFGLDQAPEYTRRWLDGKMTLRQVGKEMAKQPVNVIIQGGEPFIKVGGELLTRRSLFPDVFRPGVVRDRIFHLLRGFGLENEYKAIAGKPTRGYGRSLKGFFMYSVDPDEAAYRDIIGEKFAYMKKQGKYGEGFFITPRGNAMYDAKLALRYGDTKSAMHYMAKYYELSLEMGKEPKQIERGMEQSLKMLDPLSGMDEKERIDFVMNFLNDDDRQRLVRAYKFYEDILTVKPQEK